MASFWLETSVCSFILWQCTLCCSHRYWVSEWPLVWTLSISSFSRGGLNYPKTRTQFELMMRWTSRQYEWINGFLCVCIYIYVFFHIFFGGSKMSDLSVVLNQIIAWNGILMCLIYCQFVLNECTAQYLFIKTWNFMYVKDFYP